MAARASRALTQRWSALRQAHASALGKLDGAWLATESSFRRDIGDIMRHGVRGEPEIDVATTRCPDRKESLRHARACPAHPRLASRQRRGWP
jgi:hypothetical protein